MSGLGDKIKSAFGNVEHSSEVERGMVDQRTPGAYPSEDSGVHGGVDQPHIGAKPVPSSGHQDLGGTSRDPGMATGFSELNKPHEKEHRSEYGVPAAQNATLSKEHGHRHADSGVGLRDSEHNINTTRDTPFSSSKNSSSQHDSKMATDQAGRPETSAVPGTGAVSAGSSGVAPEELGADRSGKKADATNSGTAGDLGGDGKSTGGHGAMATGISQSDESHNKVASGKEKSETKSDEPYWGDLPKGTGVYNTVTGHGSGEDESTQHRNLPRTGNAEQESSTGVPGISSDGLSYGSGVYNTVTGHGSKDEHDRTHPATSHQREFPIHSGSRNTTSDTKDDLGGKDHGHEKAGLALGAAGLTAYGAAEHQRHKQAKDSDAEGGIHSTTSSAQQPAFGAISSDRPSTVTQSGGQTHGLMGQQNEALADRSKDTTYAGGVFQHHNDRSDTAAKHAESSRTTAPESQRSAQEKNNQHDRNILGFFHRNEDKPHAATQPTASQGEYAQRDAATTGNSVTSGGNTSGSTSSQPYRLTDPHTVDVLPTSGQAQPSKDQSGLSAQQETPAQSSKNASLGVIGAPSTSTAQGSHGYLSSGTASDNTRGQSLASTEIPSRQHNTSHSPAATATGSNQYNQLHDGTPSGIARNVGDEGQPSSSTIPIGKGPTASSAGTQGSGKYNVLSSGTPSGVQVGATPAAEAGGVNSTTSKSPSQMTHTPSTTMNPTGHGYSGSDASQVSPRTTGYQPNTDTSNASTAGLAAAGGSAVASKLGSGSNMTHKCTNCGVENDISGYFK
jgi:hypothetical protein